MSKGEKKWSRMKWCLKFKILRKVYVYIEIIFNRKFLMVAIISRSIKYFLRERERESCAISSRGFY